MSNAIALSDVNKTRNSVDVKSKLLCIKDMNDEKIQEFIDYPSLFWKNKNIREPKNMLKIVRECATLLGKTDSPMAKLLRISVTPDSTWRSGVNLYEFNTMKEQTLNDILSFILLSCIV